MAWNWPVITYVRKKWTPDKKPETPPEPDKEKPEEIPAEPDPVVVTPSSLNVVNYLRALMILRNTPFKKLWAEFLKLPLKKLAYATGLIIWVYMTYTLVTQLLSLLFK